MKFELQFDPEWIKNASFEYNGSELIKLTDGEVTYLDPIAEELSMDRFFVAARPVLEFILGKELAYIVINDANTPQGRKDLHELFKKLF